MITRGNRRGGKPVLVDNGTGKLLERIPFEGKTFNEKWIQDLIHQQPDILPISEIESGFSPAIAIGKEISTPSGYIDNLFISPEGYLTIIETKLWRNSEARREVVGQIIDYAKELKKWSYTQLDDSVKLYNQLYNRNTDGLLETVRKYADMEESDEQIFIDNISKNLSRGRFLLLIVGDGIRESVEDMVEYLSQSAQVYFTLALIELQVYKFDESNNSYLIIPQLVTRTKEITRAIVRVEAKQLTDLTISIETDLGMESGKQGVSVTKRTTITAEDFFDQLEKSCGKEIVEFSKTIIKDCEEMGLYIEWNTGSFSVRLPDPTGSGMKFSIMNIDRGGLFYLGYSKGKFDKLNLPIEIKYNFVGDTAALLPGVSQNKDKKYAWDNYSTLQDLQKHYVSFMALVKKYAMELTEALEKNAEQ